MYYLLNPSTDALVLLHLRRQYSSEEGRLYPSSTFHGLASEVIQSNGVTKNLRVAPTTETFRYAQDDT